MRNDYDGLVDRWKVDLVATCARRRGFSSHDLDDAEQEIVPALVSFRFEKERSNGATEATAITALVIRRLSLIRRSAARRRQREEKYRESESRFDGTAPADPIDNSLEEGVALACDVRGATARLAPAEQAVCTLLSEGFPLLHVAQGLGLSRYAAERIVEGIRRRFRASGLGAWVGAK